MNIDLATNNPYALTGFLQEFTDGTTGLYRNRIKYVPSRGDRLHLVQKGEMLDSIASIYYKQTNAPERFYFLIADANDPIINPFDISNVEGTEIIIPDLAFALLNE